MSQRDDGSGGSGSDSGDSFLNELLGIFPLPPTPQPGDRLGGKDSRRFEILGNLGRGGMGVVVRARDEVLQRVVALKFIAPGRELTQESLDRLLQDEARLIAQLDHENIVRIFDVAEWRGFPFLIMECLEGQSLADVLRHGPLELPRALHILGDIMAGLAHAHSRQIIHRDLKPSNVFVLPDERVKLLDFGLALFVSSLGSAPSRTGTPAFMAPEQWRGQPQDMRTDTWAAGLLLYQMLTGALPYPTGEPQALREQVVSNEPVPSVRVRRPDLPIPVERFLARALAKEPARRFQSALEMRERLRVLEWSLVPSAELPPPRFVSHRRQVTLVCCRLSGRLAAFEPEDLSDLHATFHQASARILERHGAWVALRMGDEVLGCFGYPLAREDDVLCAVRAALALTRLAEELPQASETELTAQVGVHTDMVVLDVFNNPSGATGHSPSIQGEAPRMALWLAEQAAPHTALLSENTWQGARGNFVTEPLGPRVFSSSRGTVRMDVHRLVAERPESTRFGRARTRGLTPLVGRRAELHQLLAIWDRTRQGQGAVVLLSGEAGIGKSRLIQEVCDQIKGEGAFCVSSQCWPQLSHSAFHPVLEWVVQLLGLDPEDSPSQSWACLEEVRKSLELPHPEGMLLLGQLLDLPLREDLPPLLLSPELQRERTLETLATTLLRLPARTPEKGGPGARLLVLEDLHWADPSTLQLLSLLCDRIEKVRLCMLLSTRPELWLSWRNHPNVHPLMLERLMTDETTELVRRLTRNRTDLSARTVEFLVKRTEGIPLYVEELTRMVLARPVPENGEPTEGPLPVTLQELLLARLDPLPQEQKELAWMGAVIGRGFTREQLAALAEREENALERDLEELVEAGLLLRRSEDPAPRYEFKHALIREAAYESLLKSRRRQYHHRYASLLENPSGGCAAAPPELIAHHYTQAGELEPAIRFWTQAGELALRRSAFEESVSHLELAFRLFQRLPGATRRVEEELRLLVILGQAQITVRSYAAPEVEQVYARITELFQEVKDRPLLVAVCRSLFNQNLLRLNIPLARELAKQIVSLGQRIHEPQVLSIGWLMGAMNQLIQGNPIEAQKQFSEALAQSDSDLTREPQALGMLEPDPLAMALAYQALTLTIRGEQQQGQQLLDAALQRTQWLAHLYSYILTSHAACILYQMRFDGQRLLETTELVIAIYEQNQFPSRESWMPVLRGWALVWTGKRDEGYALLLQGLEQLRQVGSETGWPYLLSLLADARLRLGLIDEGLAAVSEGLAWGERTEQHMEDAELHRLRGELLLRTDDAAQAPAEFHAAIQAARRSGARCLELRAFLSLCHLLQAQGRVREARRLLAEHLESLPPGLDSPELRVARVVLSRLQEAHGEQPESAESTFDAPWTVHHL